MLLERTPALQTLEALRLQAASQGGCVALIAGEAGIGKTSLLRRFTQLPACAAMTPLWGACGPLHDMAGALGSGVTAALARDAGRNGIFNDGNPNVRCL